MTESKIADVLALLVGSYPRQALGAATLNAYTVMLVDLDGDQAMRAVTELVATSKWFPSIAEIRERAAESTAGVPDFDQAWDEVQARIQDTGYGPMPQWSSPALADSVRAIGWKTLCHDENQATVRAQFRDMYAKRREREVRDENVEPLLETTGISGKLVAGVARELTKGSKKGNK
jgi:hypothetical protein